MEKVEVLGEEPGTALCHHPQWHIHSRADTCAQEILALPNPVLGNIVPGNEKCEI